MADERPPVPIEESHPVVIFDLTTLATKPCFDFIVSNGEVVTFLQDFAKMAHGQEQLMRAIAEDENYWKAQQESYRQFREGEGNPVELDEAIDTEPLKEMLLNMVPKADETIGKHVRLLHQMLLARAMDNFNLYVSELLLLMYRTKLGAERAEDSGIEAFVQQLVDRFVEGASLGGLKRLPSEFKQTFGIKLFKDNASQHRVERIAAYRNIITHNRGIANRYFLNQVKDSGLQVGEPVPFAWEDVRSDVSFLLNLVLDIDKRVAERFALPRKPLQQSQPDQSSAASHPLTQIQG